MAKISLTLTDGGSTVYVDDTDVVKFQDNTSGGSLVYIYNLKAKAQVLDVTQTPSQVAAKSPLFASLTQVLSVFPTAAVTFTLTGSTQFLGGEPVAFASGAANGQINTTNGSTTMTATSMSGQTLANGMGIIGLDSGAIGTVSGTPTYTYSSTQAFYVNSARIIEYQDAGFDGVRFIQVNDGTSPNGQQIFVSDSIATLNSVAALGAYVTIGGAQTISGAKTFDTPLVTKANVTQATSITTGVTANGSAGIITTVSSTLAADATAEFTVTNSAVAATSVVLVSIADYAGTYGTNGIPVVNVDSIAAGSFKVDLSNVHSTNALSGVVKISYLVV